MIIIIIFFNIFILVVLLVELECAIINNNKNINTTVQ